MKYFFLLYVFLCFGSIQAQTDFPESDAVWVNKITCHDPWSTYLCDAEFYCLPGEDTLIDGQNYSKLYRCDDEVNMYQGSLRVDAEVVYYIPVDSITEFVLYDFTLEEGDSISNFWMLDSPFYDTLIVSSTAIESFDGIDRKVINFESTGGRWVQGLGSDWGLLRELWHNISGYFVELQCMSVGDSSYYPLLSDEPCDMNFGSDIGIRENELNSLKIFPNPAQTTVEISGDFTEIQLSDLSGKIILKSSLEVNSVLDIELLSPGIYWIQAVDKNGAKYQNKLIVE